MILTNGYYKSELISREDMHAGGKLESQYYVIYVFNDNGDFTSTYLDKIPNLISKNQLAYKADKNRKYYIKNDVLTLCYSCNTEIERKFNFQLISSELFLDEDQNIYHFHPWPE